MVRLYFRVFLTWKYRALLTFSSLGKIHCCCHIRSIFFPISLLRLSHLLPFGFFASVLPAANPSSTFPALQWIVLSCCEQLMGPHFLFIPEGRSGEVLLRSHSVNIKKSEGEQEMAGFLQFTLHAFGKKKVVNSYTEAAWLPKVTSQELTGTLLEELVESRGAFPDCCVPFSSVDCRQWGAAWFQRGRGAEPKAGWVLLWSMMLLSLHADCHQGLQAASGSVLAGRSMLWSICGHSAGNWPSFCCVSSPSTLQLLREPCGERWEHPHQPWSWYQLWIWVGHCWNTDGERSGWTGEGTPNTERVKSWCGPGSRRISDREPHPLWNNSKMHCCKYSLIVKLATVLP